jgi:hypothetical protein
VPGGWRFNDGIPSAMVDAMDPFTWASEGLVDIIAPSEPTALMMQIQSLDRFRKGLRGTPCELWGAIGPQYREALPSRWPRNGAAEILTDADPWRIMALAHDFYQQGADGVFVWEAQDLAAAPTRWSILRHLGDREYLRHAFGDKLGPFDGSHWIPCLPLT